VSQKTLVHQAQLISLSILNGFSQFFHWQTLENLQYNYH